MKEKKQKNMRKKEMKISIINKWLFILLILINININFKDYYCYYYPLIEKDHLGDWRPEKNCC